MANFPRYDLFSGSPGKEPLWMEAADDLRLASDRMKQLGRDRPGRYFIYSYAARAVVESIDTFSSPPQRQRL